MTKADFEKQMKRLGKAARKAARAAATASTAERNHALEAMAEALLKKTDHLITENHKDLQAGRDKGLDSAMLDRLELDQSRIESMADGLKKIISLDDPVGQISDMQLLESGIKVGKMRVPLGVIGIIYESRPNVTADAAGLCLKSGNACILRGGSEALHSNLAILTCLRSGLKAAGLDRNIIQVVPTTDRRAVGSMLQMEDSIDVIIPRGGKSLIERVSKESKIPVIKHLDGVCHVYVDEDADLDMAREIALNAKTHRYGVCNAMETLLVHQAVARRFLGSFSKDVKKHKVELRGCSRTRKILRSAKKATTKDWTAEYLAPVLAIKVVDHFEEAVTHIEKYGSHHTDAIVTENHTLAMQFLSEVDSSTVLVNASTRFADGFEFGLGAEIGISTDKLHVRGPVGLEGLTNQKYIVLGNGQIRA